VHQAIVGHLTHANGRTAGIYQHHGEGCIRLEPGLYT
jgi:hypothetical protein